MLLGKLIGFKVKCKNSLRQGASGGADVAFCRSPTANETQSAAAIFHFIGDLSYVFTARSRNSDVSAGTFI